MMAPSPELVAHPGAIATLAERPELRAQSILLVSDRGLEAAGHVDRVQNYLEVLAGEVTRFTEVRPNPTSVDVALCLEALASHTIIVALGGGSVMDVAKLAALMRSAGGSLADHAGVHETRRDHARLILIPTTAGTGSEAQAAAIVSDETTHRKLACLAPGLAADLVILDARLTLTCPHAVTAASGMDALTHALEVAVTTARNARSDALATRAFVTLAAALPRVLEAPDDLEARQTTLMAAHEAGKGIAMSMLGAAHAAGNALTARYGTPHGQAVASMLPAVIRHNALLREVEARYAALASAAGLEASSESLAIWVEELLTLAFTTPCSIAQEDISSLASEAAEQWTGRFNPRPLVKEDFEALFEASR